MLIFNAHPVAIIIILELLVAAYAFGAALSAERKVTRVVNYIMTALFVFFAVMNGLFNI